MGRWSEESSCSVCHVHLCAISGDASDMSAEVGLVLMLYGLRVGWSVMLSVTSECSWSCMSMPRLSVFCVASHVGLCALGSPRMRWFCCVLRWSKSGVYPWGHDVGGMYMLVSVMSCFCSLTLMVCNSNVLSGCMYGSVCDVVLVNGLCE